jgi:molecular chaperone DnaK (HSP70)
VHRAGQPGLTEAGAAVTYTLGLDLGTTYTAAAIAEAGRAEIFPLGRRQAAVPTVVYIGTDRVLVGEAAVQRAVDEPERVAREFKRRVGDPVPLVLGGSPWSAEQLLARVLAWVLDRVGTERGSNPERLAVTYPAQWGRWKRDVLDEALHLVAAAPPVTTVTEPEAAAVHYATSDRLDPGDSIAVYDLGGGSFDVSILRAVTGGFEFVGSPAGIERMGGIDFDEVVYRHVLRHATDGDEPDTDDPGVLAALARLRDACVDAKEALSFDTRATVPVVLPGVTTTVAITRSEFESMIRPPLEETVAVLERALESAGMRPSELRAVLLVGGSSRIPLVGQVVSGALGRPVAVDAHPKHPVALGAAVVAGRDRPATWPAAANPTPPPWSAPAPAPSPLAAEPARWPVAPPPPPAPPSAPAEPVSETALEPEPVPAPAGDEESTTPRVGRWVVPVVTLAVLVLVVVIALIAR